MKITGRIAQKQSIITGTISKPSHIHGTISKPSSEHAKSDHVFVTVDLLKLYAAQTNVVNANATADMSATNTQNVSSQLDINISSATVTVNQVTVTE